MRYNVLVATALLAVWGCQPPVDQTDAGAEYCLVTPVIALGRIAAKEDPQVATFRLKNRTSAPVRIREIRKSCTCFAVRMSAEQVPAQGESGFDVTVAADTPGKHSASVTILLDDEKKTALQAVLSWEVTAAYTSGGSSVDFGNVLVGEVAYRQVELTRECDHCTLRAVETGGNGIKITSVQESEGRVKVNVVLESSLEARNYHGTLRIKVSNAWPESYNIPVRWTVREEIAAVPRRL